MQAQQQLSNSALASIAADLQPRLDMNDYADSVVELFKVARHGTSSGRTAAQLLLSGYNGRDWQLSVTDLCLLDRTNRAYALTYLECRATLGREPHELLKDGYIHFGDLAKQWRKLHIDNRWKDQCRDCYGDGEVLANPEDENDETTMECYHCNGTGMIANVREF